jgi:hypothetical protein
MYLFYVTEPLALHAEPVAGARRGAAYRLAVPDAGAEVPPGVRTVMLEPPVGGTLTPARLYFGYSRPFLRELAEYSRRAERPSLVRLLSRAAEAEVLSRPGLPVRIGHRAEPELRQPLEDQLARAGLPPRSRVAVINPFGLAFGDSVVMLTALREFRRRLEERVGPLEIHVLQHPDTTETEEIYLRSGVADALHHLPAPVSAFARYDAYVDLSTAYESHGLPWPDDLLELFAIDPATVPAARKRNVLPAWPRAAAELDPALATLRARGRPLVLLHHRASLPLRSIPDRRAARLVREVLERTDWTVVSALPLPLAHPRFADLSALTPAFEHLAHLVSRVDAFLCVDTCVYHVADAADVPGVVLFNSLDPAHRVTYYPGIQGILLGAEDSPIRGEPLSGHPEHLAHAESLWDQVDADDIVERIRGMLAPRMDVAA